MRTDILERKNDILQWMEEHQSKAFICRELKCKPETLASYLKKMDINYEGNKGLKGKTLQEKGQSNVYKTAAEYIKSTCVKSPVLKEKLLREGIKEYKCEICGGVEWLGKPIPLELDHIDGNHYNNDFTNLRIICPNCHSLTPTNAGKNVGTYK